MKRLFALLCLPLAARGACAPYKQASEILSCALKRHPYLVRETSRLRQGDELSRIAGEFPNPEFDAKFASSSELAVYVPIELGGKRGARRLQAKAQKLELAATGVSVEEQVALTLVSDLHKIRQRLEERERYNEAIAGYERILKQYRSRGRLSPEQQVSLTLFEMAAAESKARRSLLESELMERVRSIEFATGESFDPKTAPLPELPKNWPEITDRPQANSGAEVLRAKAELATAGAELSLAQANAWPDLRVGPLVLLSNEGGTTRSSFGVALSLPLPLFNLNGGRRAHAHLGIEMAARNLEAVQGLAAKERANLAALYRSSIAAFRSFASETELDRQHRRVESLFERGMVAGSLVIESHRQMLSFLDSLHEQEIRAIEALWKIYAIDGEMSPAKLL